MHSGTWVEPWLLAYHDLRGLYPLMSVLRSNNLHIQTTRTSASILTMARQGNPPAVILLDTDMDGLSVCRALKACHATASIPVFLLTDAAEPACRVEGLRAGADEYIVNPWEPDEVLLRLHRHLNEHALSCFPALAGKQERVEAWSRAQELVWAAQQYLIHAKMPVPAPRELACLMGTTESALNAAFQGVLGIRLYEYLRACRLGIAATLLSSSGLKVADIAEVAGYSDSANFATAFRGVTGMAPTVYRERSRCAASQAAD